MRRPGLVARFAAVIDPADRTAIGMGLNAGIWLLSIAIVVDHRALILGALMGVAQ